MRVAWLAGQTLRTPSVLTASPWYGRDDDPSLSTTARPMGLAVTSHTYASGASPASTVSRSLALLSRGSAHDLTSSSWVNRITCVDSLIDSSVSSNCRLRSLSAALTTSSRISGHVSPTVL